MLHAETLRLFGGSPGVRDEGMLQSALARPRHLWASYETATLFDLAAAYGLGMARNHAFVDGNRRAALLATRAFLFRNGLRFQPDEVVTVTFMEAVAAGTVDQGMLAEWLEANAE